MFVSAEPSMVFVGAWNEMVALRAAVASGVAVSWVAAAGAFASAAPSTEMESRTIMYLSGAERAWKPMQ